MVMAMVMIMVMVMAMLIVMVMVTLMVTVMIMVMIMVMAMATAMAVAMANSYGYAMSWYAMLRYDISLSHSANKINTLNQTEKQQKNQTTVYSHSAPILYYTIQYYTIRY